MTRGNTTQSGWTIDTLAQHIEALRESDARFQDERDRRYRERDESNKQAVKDAMAAADKAAEKTEVALKEYKVGANEWRSTVQDLIARQGGQSQGKDASWSLLLGAAALIVSLIAIGSFVFRAQPVTQPAPQIFYTPAQPGTLIPSPSQQQAAPR